MSEVTPPMNGKTLDVATLRAMAEVMSNLEFAPAELERILPYVNNYLAGMEKVAHVGLPTEPQVTPSG